MEAIQKYTFIVRKEENRGICRNLSVIPDGNN